MSNVMLDTSQGELICQKCGYDLRGLSHNRCPECGEVFDPHAVIAAKIPWLRPSRIGLFSAYCQTVAMVMLHPMKLSHEVWYAARLDPRAAARFRWSIILQALTTAALMVAVLCWGNASRLLVQIKWISASEVVVLISLSIFLTIATDIVPGNAWERAVNHYACAPLAMFPIAGVLTVLAQLLRGPIELVAAVAFGSSFVWWWICHVLVMYVVHGSIVSAIAHTLLLPIGWLFIALASILCGAAAGSLVMLFWSHVI